MIAEKYKEHVEGTITGPSFLECFIDSVKFFVYKIFFQLLCYKVGIKSSKDEIFHLWKSQTLKPWIKIVYQIAFYPKRRLLSHIRALEKCTKQSIDTDSIGPGMRFLSWFQNLHSETTTSNYSRLTKKQVAFVLALSNKLETHPPSTIFAILKSRKLINAWFSIAKVLSKYSFEELGALFEDLSEKTSLIISPNDLLNSGSMLAWLERSLQVCHNINMQDGHPFDKNNPQEWSVRSHYYFICEATTRCWKCEQKTPVYAIALPSESFTWWMIEEEEDEEKENVYAWVQEKYPGILQYVTEFSENSFQSNEFEFHSVFYKDFSKSANMSYWMNHCTHCGIKQGDNALHKPGCAFWPLTILAAERLKLYRCLRPISARGTRLEFLCLSDIPIGS